MLVDFWTYTCINWRRTLPYVRAWAEKYKDHGLVVIGVHTPEFSFEKDLGNVHRAMTGLAIRYPIAVDSDHLIWRAFSNQYWPATYVADARGRIRYHQFGEGDYEQTERVIQQLLTEAGNANVPRELVSLDPEGVEKAADWANVKSPETYVGYERAESFASPGDVVRHRPCPILLLHLRRQARVERLASRDHILRQHIGRPPHHNRRMIAIQRNA